MLGDNGDPGADGGGDDMGEDVHGSHGALGDEGTSGEEGMVMDRIPVRNESSGDGSGAGYVDCTIAVSEREDQKVSDHGTRDTQ